MDRAEPDAAVEHDTPHVEAVARATAPALAQGEACLVAIYGPRLGQRWRLDRRELLVGRDESCDLVVPIDTVSRRHCRLLVHPGTVSIEDLGSTNGTSVNDVPVGANEEVSLASGDRIRVGAALFKFLHGADVEALYHEEVYRTIVLDGLTGAYTRRHLFEQLEREMSRCQRHRRPLSLLVLDLDHFKRVNDELGHLSGDVVLREVAGRIAGMLRPEDCFARFGGEEFAVVLPETGLDAARALAEQLRAAIAAEPFLVHDEMVPVTVSIGIAAMDGALREPDHFFAAADARLYEAKDAGRDCVRG